MLIVFDSKTGNVKRFVGKLGLESAQIVDGLKVNRPFVLITFTTGFGQVPKSTADFLEENGEWLQGVAVSGNMNWGARFGLAADRISDAYNVPILMKFELSGTNNDVERMKREVNNIVIANTKMDTA
ncbi:class Ib ribonucleoside-diphosphate reductase assembly flavoprotein NrdI [Paenibacillus sp. CECT 9249]|uniref:class Ib ribonucleoside-diphosphate reductase assembly flavoprotein NrdI n=1 Tax=unclassified Paenibacillus TaxID=185978 RepID=UPI001C1272A4|nr:class Ib ribonucleoside-diphosphate reductase assembly flavoprotein NrdI [Paenibacillus sp. CECT 9249]MBU5445310.1 class Ib ribonucleoside-diphosphate reductase assembly flavoprotein NrdI [Paenibacillus sp. MSJ-34]CAH0118534.1 Protein NrdI [Paenibacillus sp. CECT 9249]